MTGTLGAEKGSTGAHPSFMLRTIALRMVNSWVQVDLSYRSLVREVGAHCPILRLSSGETAIQFAQVVKKFFGVRRVNCSASFLPDPMGNDVNLRLSALYDMEMASSIFQE